jgi:hypothetical protein
MEIDKNEEKKVTDSQEDESSSGIAPMPYLKLFKVSPN